MSCSQVYDQNYELFRIWLKFDAASSLFSVLAILSATIDYEVNYSSTRTYSECHEGYIRAEGFRYTTLLLNVVGLIMTLLRYKYKRLWVDTFNKLNHERLYAHRYRESAFSQRRNLLLQIIVLMIFPYPNLTTYVKIPLRIDSETRMTCYTLAEFFYCFMFVRFILIIRSVANYSVFDNEWARLSCHRFETPHGFKFAVKCLFKTRPFLMIVLIFLMLIIFASTVYRVLERPLDEFKSEYMSDPLLALWFIFETISTLGYGELYPLSYFGRTISVITYLIGAIILSLVIVELQNITDLSNNEKIVFEHVSVSKSAADLINSSIRFFIYKKKYPKTNPQVNAQLLKTKQLKAIFKYQRMRALALDFSMDESIRKIKVQVELAKIQLKLCNRDLDHSIKFLQDRY